MSRKKIIIPSIFVVLIVALFLIFGPGERRSGIFQAREVNILAPGN